MPDLNWNQATWGGNYNWSLQGEEWSEAWGGSEAQWFGALFPRIHRYLPAKRILEIAPGFGRWTKFLLPVCEDYVGIDLSGKCIEACREIFAEARHAKFHVNDGFSLADAPDGHFDFVFSFDSLVHAELDVLVSYVPQVIKKLAPGGVAFLHHSNLQTFEGKLGVPHGRAISVSADLVGEITQLGHGKVLMHEIVNWGGKEMIDCLSLITRQDSYPGVEPVRLENPLFMGEAKIIQHFQSRYSRLPRQASAVA